MGDILLDIQYDFLFASVEHVKFFTVNANII